LLGTQPQSSRWLTSVWRVCSVCSWAWGSVVDGVNVFTYFRERDVPVGGIGKRDSLFSWDTPRAVFPVLN
jgi:hypothetical protein